MRRFATGLFVLMALASIGDVMSDEQRQLLSFHNLRQGTLYVEHDAPHYFGIYPGGLQYPTFTGRIEGGLVVTSSPLVDFASLPAYFALEAVDDVVPIAALLTVLWGWLAYAVVRWGWDAAAVRLGRPRPTWTRSGDTAGLDPVRALGSWLARTTAPHRMLLGAVGAVTLWQAWTVPLFDFALWGEAMAIQLTAIVAAAAAVVAFHSLLKLLLPHQLAHVGAGVLLTATPLALWGTQIKYHGLMMSLVVFALYLYTLGWRQQRPVWRALAVVCGGLAVWNHLSGLFLLAALGLAEAVHAEWPGAAWRSVRAWRPRGRSHAVAAAALVVGLAPWMAYNTAMFGNPFTDHYFQSPQVSGIDEALLSGDAGGLGEKLEATQALYDRLYSHQRAYPQGVGHWQGTVAVFFLAHEAEGTALAVFALTPLLVLAFLAPVAAWRRRVAWSPAATIAVGVVAANWFFYIQRGQFQGAGYDLRYFTMSVPCLLLLAMMGLRWAVRDGRAVLRSAATSYAAAAMLVFSLLLATAHKNILLDRGEELMQTYVVMHALGAASCTGIALAAVGRPWLGRLQQPVLGVFLGLGMLNSHMWLATTQVLFHTGIPAHGSHPAYHHVLPAVHTLHELFREWLIPQKWGVA